MDAATDYAETLIELELGTIPVELWDRLAPPGRSAASVSRAVLGLSVLPEAADLVRAGLVELGRLGPGVRDRRYRPFVPAPIRDALDALTARLAMASRSATAVALLAAWATDIEAGIDAAALLDEGTDDARVAVKQRLRALEERNP